MTGDFNIRDCLWHPNYLFNSSHKDTLFEIADSFHIKLSKLTNNLPTRYSDNIQNSNLVLDLVFLCPDLMKLDNHYIYLEWQLTSDHAPITVNIHICEERVQTRKQSLPKNSKEEAYFIKNLICSIKKLNTNLLLSVDTLETIVQSLADNIDKIWQKHSKVVNITKHSKVWWDDNYSRDLDMYQQSR